MTKLKPMIIKDFKRILSILGKAVIVSTLLIITTAEAVNAQLHVRKLSHRASGEGREHGAGRTKELPPLTLPFFDDFSQPYINPNLKEIYPDTNRWENSYTVWVNDGLGINPPTINVASFDGLDSIGSPYNATEIFLSGFTDSLVSRPIDLSENAAVNPVAIAERNSVYLSFYYQWKGNGEAPDPDDYLLVQFKNESNEWETVSTIAVTPTLESGKFYQTLIQVQGDRFFTSGFQFQLKSFGRQSGPYDTWNVDYFYLNKNRSATDVSVPDQAISSPLTTILQGQYRAMPYYHFLANPQLVAPKFNVYNLRGDPPDVLNYFVEGVFTSYFYGADTTSSTVTLANLDPNPALPNSEGINDDGTGTIFPFESKTVTVKHISTIDTVTTLDPKADAATVELKVNLITGDNINPDTGGPADDYDPTYAPIDFRVNDTLRTRYELKNYYAYDDGVAEYAGGLISAGNVFAYRFDLPENLNDTLRLLEGFDIYFPPFGLTSNQNVDFFVFDEQGGKPGEIRVRVSSVSIRRERNNTFQRIRFLPAEEIQRNSFFVGWRQPVSGELLVGIDNSNDTSDKMFFNPGGSINPDPAAWVANNVVKGSFMVRPVFSRGRKDPTTGIEEDTKLALYPNPNRGAFQIAGKPENLSVITITGQAISFQTEAFDDRTYVRVNAPAGLYLVRYSSHGVVHAHKVIITQ
ncbi:MAG TPA: T9SS type A sorting domain-containing protein [Chryseosolibacter sp.]